MTNLENLDMSTDESDPSCATPRGKLSAMIKTIWKALGGSQLLAPFA